MITRFIVGSTVVAGAGLLSGSAVWPIKRMRRYQFEHWWFAAMLTGLLLVPWTVTLAGCPHVLKAIAAVPLETLLAANLWAAGWGVANVLCGLCYLRLGVALTTAILAGLGLSVGALLPLVVKGSGVFQTAAGLTSPAGLMVLAGVGVTLAATVLAGLAGAGRERRQAGPAGPPRNTAGFLPALLLAVAAGLLSGGMSLSFVYGQGPIIAAMKHEGAGDLSATYAVWAVGLLGGAVPCVGYPAWRMTRNRSWGVLLTGGRELALAVIIGLNVTAAVALLGSGMLLLGPLGASVGFGIQQAAWMLGGQGLGFLSGEWRGVTGRPRRQISAAILLLLAAILLLAWSDALPRA